MKNTSMRAYAISLLLAFDVVEVSPVRLSPGVLWIRNWWWTDQLSIQLGLLQWRLLRLRREWSQRRYFRIVLRDKQFKAPHRMKKPPVFYLKTSAQLGQCSWCSAEWVQAVFIHLYLVMIIIIKPLSSEDVISHNNWGNNHSRKLKLKRSEVTQFFIRFPDCNFLAFVFVKYQLQYKVGS